MRSILGKLPEKAQMEMKVLLHQVCRASSYRKGLRLRRITLDLWWDLEALR